MIDLLRKAQNFSLDDQRGKIDSKSLEIPEFLLTNNLIKNQMSSSQNLGNLNSSLNISTLSLPLQTANSTVFKDKKSSERNATRSRSPILIVYDYEEEDNCSLNESIDIYDKSINEIHFPHQSFNEQRILEHTSNELNSQNCNNKSTPNTTQISYV
jgi:hypothetical protein